jgi:hypothetical protein
MRWMLPILFWMLVSCQKEVTTCEDAGQPCSQEEQFYFNKSKWEDSGIVNYTMQFQIICYCIYREPFQVVVKNNQVDSFTGNEDYCDRSCVMTIDELFAEIQSLIDRNPDYYDIEYDPVYGFPSKSFFDLAKNIADEEIGYQIDQFMVK